MHCRSCQTDKPDSAFYATNKTRCRDCIKDSARAYRLTNLERVRQYDRMRASQPHRVASRAEYEQTDAGRKARQAARNRYAAKRRGGRPPRSERLKPSPELMEKRRKARMTLGNAIRDGKVLAWPVCALPNCTHKAEAHHPDYDRPLDVVWLCRTHHRQAHALVGPQWPRDSAQQQLLVARERRNELPGNATRSCAHSEQ